MYRKIENLYLKESIYNKIKRTMFFVYFIGVFISLVFNIFKLYILIAIILVLTFLLIKISCERILKMKLSFRKNYAKKERIREKIRDTDKRLLKEYLEKENLFCEKSLLCILMHYRSMNKPKNIEFNLLNILSLTIPVLLSFVTPEGFEFKELTNFLPYLVLFTSLVVSLYFVCGQLIQLKSFFKGEDGMVEILEEIFSELYVEYIIEEKKLVTGKQDNKKRKRKI